MSLQAHRPVSSPAASLPRYLISGLIACGVALLLVSCEMFPNGFLAPSTFSTFDSGSRVGVGIQNSTEAPFYAMGVLIPVGGRPVFSSYSKLTPFTTFDIARGGSNASNAVALARVSFRILKYPEGSGEQEVTITVTESSAGVFSATTFDTSWIEILGVSPLG